ncbi:hypothetical protein QWY85_11660 [Neolewinella lacunae]|uniref:Uncharacterized protein n=1 Tax=Neolewinella lacunae TaxID=1517758 RepID=A0A923TCJ5_9BACT|nr:hypothetical protein [Neolewinella lacunae]MBC6993792.1 hypothetical protein [Neolewinella lacunae]MDN3635317.1 hypothetical protein [Neolewinella lacunae]
MLRNEFQQSLEGDAPPVDCGPEIIALWLISKRHWQEAHDLIDATPGRDAAWIHALLHRMEGDKPNADYWYARAGRSRPDQTIGQELEALLEYFLD